MAEHATTVTTPDTAEFTKRHYHFAISNLSETDTVTADVGGASIIVFPRTTETVDVFTDASRFGVRSVPVTADNPSDVVVEAWG